MKILFGEVTGSYLDSLLEDASTMYEQDGSYFDFELEMNPECFTIRDTCGRSIPIGIAEFADFIKAVKIANNYAKALNKHAVAVEAVMDDEVLTICV